MDTTIERQPIEHVAVLAYQRWRDLVFVHWKVPSRVLRRLVPAELELDTYQGSPWVTMVTLAVEGSRAAVLPAALGMDFGEINLRTYVKHGGERGIWFFSLDAGSRASAWGTRWLTGLPYRYGPVRCAREEDEIRVELARAKGPSLRMRARPGDAVGSAKPGSLDHFLIERYTLFARREGVLLRQRVQHVPYPLHRLELLELEESLLANAEIQDGDGAFPVAATHYATGLEVEILAPDRV